MKLFIFLATALSSFSILAHTKKPDLHILPDVDSAYYQEALRQAPQLFFTSSSDVQKAIAYGERNLKWLKYMNSFRGPQDQLALTKPGGLNGIPIESPKKYGPLLIKKDLDQLKLEIPKSLAAVLFENVALPSNPPVSDQDYIFWARKVDGLYQSAVRWTLLAPYKDHYAAAKKEDVRGYYFLVREVNLESKLRSYDSQKESLKLNLKDWLQTLCQNSEGIGSKCSGLFSAAVKSKKVFEFYQKYFSGGDRLWKSHFEIRNPRKKVSWNKYDPQIAIFPFKDPANSDVAEFLKVNIEDEWQWLGWQLKIQFSPMADVRVRFVPGVTPNVNGLGGNLITMDSNAPLTEWDVQWTIRHEFGHVLGFPDCYVEFYEPAEQAMVNYQIDVDNLMCSRKGKLQQQHFEQMQKYYYKN